MSEQRTPYIGYHARPYLRFAFSDLAGATHDLLLLADTGSSYSFILHPTWFDRLVQTRLHRLETNFGRMTCGWLHVYMPEMSMVELMRGYANRRIGESLAEENPDFAGLVGLPVLRLGEYGGNATDFWFRYPPPTPIAP